MCLILLLREEAASPVLILFWWPLLFIPVGSAHLSGGIPPRAAELVVPAPIRRRCSRLDSVVKMTIKDATGELD